MKPILRGARLLVRSHEQTGTVAPSEIGRLPPVPAHQLASAHANQGTLIESLTSAQMRLTLGDQGRGEDPSGSEGG
jgi:hypothetical protein